MQLLVIPFLLSCITAQSNAGNGNDTSILDQLPIVDLGYVRHQALSFNTTGAYYNFSNIRFAAPPVGELRFAAPQKPTANRSAVQTGHQGHICPQAIPDWYSVATQFVPRYLDGERKFDESSFPNLNSSGESTSLDPRINEDCLFLDVMVPERVFHNAGDGFGAPVLVWIYGGGYTIGSKVDLGNPAGLIKASQSQGADGVIFVALNYRLGAFGWLSGPTFQTNGTANAGLLDQRMALEWVQDNIAKFGGDPNRVTVFGQSAGGGSIIHHITAWGGVKARAPFAQAITQSPAYFPIVSNREQENIFQDFLQRLNVSTIQEARQLSSKVLQAANAQQIGASVYGAFTFGPAIDHDYVPGLPIELLLHGQFDDDVRLMVGHTANEGLLFTSPFMQNTSGIEQNLVQTLPSLRGTPDSLRHILNNLYPPVWNATQKPPYLDPIGRSSAIEADMAIVANTFALNKAYENNTYAYLFDVYPALHGDDVPYTFYNGPSPDVTATHTALTLQHYITQFAMTGSPNGPGLPFFHKYGTNASILVLSDADCKLSIDLAANERSNWWQKVLYI